MQQQHYVTSANLAFGFEYETLMIYDKDKNFNNLLNKVKAHKDINWTTECDTRNSNSNTLERFVVASIFNMIAASKFNNQHYSVEFKAAKAYHEDPCTINGLLEDMHVPYLLDRSKELQTWAVTFDSSVDKLGDRLAYTTFINFLTDEKKDKTVKVEQDKQLYKNYMNVLSSQVIDKIEFVSPILYGVEHFDRTTVPPLQAVIEEIFEYNNIFQYWNNKNTSNHVHVSLNVAQDQTTNNLFNNKLDEDPALKIIMAWFYFEPLFLLCVGHWRRKNRYAKTLRHVVFDQLQSLDPTLSNNILLRLGCGDYTLDNLHTFLKTKGIIVGEKHNLVINMFQGPTRYTALNLMNCLGGGHGTIEVRLKQGSSDTEENMMWLRLLGFFMVAAHNNPYITAALDDNTKNEFIKAFTVAESSQSQTFQLFGVQESVWANYTRFEIIDESQNKVLYSMLDIFKQFLLFGNNPDERKHVNDVYNYWNNIINVVVDPKDRKDLNSIISPQQQTNTAGGSSRSPPTRSRNHYVFSYGSNSSVQIKERVGRNTKNCVLSAVLKNHCRTFAGWSARWGGAVASVVPCKGVNTYGSVFELTTSEINKLDTFEGGYDRVVKEVFIKTPEGTMQPIKAFVYVKQKNVYKKPPSAKYLEAIHTMLREGKRGHKNKIMIRALDDATGKITVKGYWSPEEGVVLAKGDAATGPTKKSKTAATSKKKVVDKANDAPPSTTKKTNDMTLVKKSHAKQKK